MVQCDPGSTSRMIDADCKCHLLIEDYELSTQYGAAVKVSCQVLGAADKSQIGKQHTEFFQCEGNAVDKFYNLCEAVGLVTVEERKAAAEAGVGLVIEESLLKGRQVCAEIKMEPNMRNNPATGNPEVNPEKPGPYPRIGFRSFSVHSDKAKDIPKDPEFIGMLSQQKDMGPLEVRNQQEEALEQAAQRQQPPQQPPPSQAPGPTGAGMGW